VHAFVVFSGAPSVIDECRAAIATMRAVAADFGGDWPQTVALVDARDAGIVTGRVALGVCVLYALSLHSFTSEYSNYHERKKKEKKKSPHTPISTFSHALIDRRRHVRRMSLTAATGSQL
jgi:hypothetical protein